VDRQDHRSGRDARGDHHRAGGGGAESRCAEVQRGSAANVSISETFLRKNQNQSAEDALEELEKIQKRADDAALDVVVYISMAFGNPYGDLWNVEEVIEAISLMEVDNLRMISLADTVGMATPGRSANWWAR
jgi:isopropylmalate/homocitrate/citramalate synthase